MTRVVITSVVELSKAQHDSIVAAVTAKYGKDVDVQTEIDPSIIGGVQIRIGATLFDGSVAGKLTQLKNSVTA